MKLAVQNKAKRVKISNIEFAITSKLKQLAPKLISFNNIAIQSELNPKVPLRESVITRNSFIPKTRIKSHHQLEHKSKTKVQHLHPASLTYSNFPQRKPLSAKTSRSFIPIFREKIFSFCNHQDLDIDKIHPQSSPKIKSRSNTTSCLVYRSTRTPEKEIMSRSNKTCRGDRLIHSFKTSDDRWQTVQRLYL